MIVVSDTTPLRHLIAIGQVELLRKLYGAVVVPGAVWTELQAESTPSAVKAWLQSAPDWLQVRRNVAGKWQGHEINSAKFVASPRNNFTLVAWAMWRRHSCRLRPDSSGRLPGVPQSACARSRDAADSEYAPRRWL
jgi:hypothetical protein